MNLRLNTCYYQNYFVFPHYFLDPIYQTHTTNISTFLDIILKLRKEVCSKLKIHGNVVNWYMEFYYEKERQLKLFSWKYA